MIPFKRGGTMNRPDLFALLGKRVTVKNGHGSIWTGKLLAIADEPSVVIEQTDGTRMSLPQSFTITEDAAPETHGMAWRHHCGRINEGQWRPRAVCGDCRTEVTYESHVDHYMLTVVPAVDRGDDLGAIPQRIDLGETTP